MSVTTQRLRKHPAPQVFNCLHDQTFLILLITYSLAFVSEQHQTEQSLEKSSLCFYSLHDRVFICGFPCSHWCLRKENSHWWVIHFLNFHDPKIAHHVVVTCMATVEVLPAQTIRLHTHTIQTVSGTSDQDTQSFGCSSLMSSKFTGGHLWTLTTIVLNSLFSFKFKHLFFFHSMEVCSNCVCDSVSIYDGSSISSSLLGKVCGRNTATFYSTGPYLTVHFRTDNSVSSSGFRAFYEVVGTSQWLLLFMNFKQYAASKL